MNKNEFKLTSSGAFVGWQSSLFVWCVWNFCLNSARSEPLNSSACSFPDFWFDCYACRCKRKNKEWGVRSGWFRCFRSQVYGCTQPGNKLTYRWVAHFGVVDIRRSKFFELQSTKLPRHSQISGHSFDLAKHVVLTIKITNKTPTILKTTIIHTN